MTYRRGYFVKPFSMVFQLVVIAVLTGGWTNQLNRTKAASPYATQLVADSKYMMGLLNTRGPDVYSMHINLADPRQYQFVINRLLVAGKTPANSPHLFERISAMRAKSQARSTNQAPATRDAANTFNCTHLLRLDPGTRVGDNMKYTDDTAVVTCEGGADYVYADISAYNSNASGSESDFLASNSGEEYAGGTDFDSVGISPELPANGERFLKSDSVVVAYDSEGNDWTSYASSVTAVLTTPPDLSVQHPIIHDFVHGGRTDQAIVLCQQRGGVGCDYAMGALNQANGTYWAGASQPTGEAAVKNINGGTWQYDPDAYFGCDTTSTGDCDVSWLKNLYVPMQGTFKTGTVAGVPLCQIQGYVKSSVTLIKSETGGGKCQITAQIPLGIGSTQASYRYLANFTNKLTENDTCSYDSVANQAVGMLVVIRAQTSCGGLYIGRDPGAATPYNSPNQLLFLNSCLAEGTRVLLVDGSSQLIEHVKLGDRVVADESGLVLSVTGIDRGVEGHPLVVLHDGQGHSIRLTEKHPVLDVKGMAHPAVDVRVGDQLAFKGGWTQITRIDRVPYQGQVYNLALGTPEELLKAGKKSGTLFAEGFLVGDKTMQRQLELAKPPASSRLSRLSKGWQRDLHNAMARNQPMK